LESLSGNEEKQDEFCLLSCILTPKLSGLNSLSRLIFRESEKALYLSASADDLEIVVFHRMSSLSRRIAGR
jgi:hypothetical protein